MTAPNIPRVSVLVATRNRAALLTRFLRSLDVAQATAAADGIECLIVDNGSSDDTAALLARWEQSGPGRVRLSVEAPGKSRALNHALGRASAPLLVFTDDDVEVAPTFFTEILAFFAGHPEYDAAIGRVLAPPNALSPELAVLLERYRTIALFDHGAAVRDEPTLHGSNMVLRRPAIDAVGGFNEQLGPGAAGGMEDQELGQRLTRSGRRIGYMPEVVVYHSIDPNRLTPDYFRQFQLVQARSRLAVDPHRAWRGAVPRLIESALGCAWWSVVGRVTRRERARGRMLRNAEILRLQWRSRRAARPLRAPTAHAIRHILMVRTDHLGDMILTTPLFAAVKAAFPTCRLTVLASAAGAAVARAHPAVDAVEVDPIEAKGSGWRGTIRLARRLRHLRCDAAVVVHSKHRLAVAVRLAGIPLRIGPGQRGYSFLFNRPVPQDHRTPPIRHETAYCMDLLRPLGIQPDAAARPTWAVDPAVAAAVEQLLAGLGIGAGRAIVTIHPGHGGSALNWTPQRYAEVADCLAHERDVVIAVTGVRAEADVVGQVCAAMRAPALNLAGQLTIPQLAALIARSVLYVGSSTGPSHLAAAVGTPVIALYCPLAECLPDRWRPLGDRCRVLVPPVEQVCPKCLGPDCRFFPCMEMIAPRAVVDAAGQFLAPGSGVG
jgi:heptosyltransferase-3